MTGNHIRIRPLEDEPVHQLTYRRAGIQGTTEVAELPFLVGTVNGLPPSLDAIVCTSDLQGVGMTQEAGQEPKLLGEIVSDELTVVLEVLGLAPVRTGIVLAGDFYSAHNADERGASGDVTPVWDAFRDRYAWVAGVMGNHDRFGAEYRSDGLAGSANAFVLDRNSCTVSGVTIAGISGIIGNPIKPLRRSARDYVSGLERLNRSKPDLLILHPSPSIAERGFWGAEEIEAALKRQAYPLTVCGHVGWPMPLVELDNGTQLLNVDSRVVVLRSARL